MQAAVRGFDVLLTLAVALAWAFAGLVVGSRLITDGAGYLLAAILFATAIALNLGNRGQGADLAVSLLGAVAWAFTAFVLASRLFSPAAGALVAVAVIVSLLSMLLKGHLQDQQLQCLLAGECPRCRRPVASEHRHRRWDASRQEWLAPATNWQCAACGYDHGEAWPCPACPAAG